MNLPNALTILRLFLVPVFVYSYKMGGSTLTDRILTTSIFVVATLTDILDGWIARKFNKVTDFGKLADPVADKLMQLSVVWCLAIDGRISLWILALFAFKEAVLIVGGLNLLKDKFVVQSKWSGKIATGILFLCVTAILLTNKAVLSKSHATAIMTVSLIFTAIAFFDYIKMYIRVRENLQKSKESK